MKGLKYIGSSIKIQHIPKDRKMIMPNILESEIYTVETQYFVQLSGAIFRKIRGTTRTVLLLADQTVYGVRVQ